jgi:hypothetical protein
VFSKINDGATRAACLVEQAHPTDTGHGDNVERADAQILDANRSSGVDVHVRRNGVAVPAEGA